MAAAKTSKQESVLRPLQSHQRGLEELPAQNMHYMQECAHTNTALAWEQPCSAC